MCETLPHPLGHFFLQSGQFKSLLAPLFKHGRHVATIRTRWFAILWMLARARPRRRKSLRPHEEQACIIALLYLIADLATNNLAAVCALAECQILIKGYSDTFERGLRQYGLITAAIHRHRHATGLAQHITILRHAAEADEHDHALIIALKSLDPAHAALAA